jgi:copper transport outer membrane protein MctB
VFDFRYHVASLAAVFIALVLGILVGVAISDPELDRRIDNAALREQVGRLQDDLDSAERRSVRGQAAEDYVERTYDAILRDRLAGKKVAVLFVGGANDGIEGAVEEVVDRAGGTLVRERAIQVPVADGIEQQVDPPETDPTDVGRALGREFVVGGETPTWDALEGQLVLQQSGSLADDVDAVVVARTAEPQAGDTARFLRGVYEGLEGAVPAVGVEESGADPSFVPVLRTFDDFSTVNNIETRVGRLALALLLAGEPQGGHYGVDAPDGVLPPVEPVTAPPAS